MKRLYVIGMGPGGAEQLTPQALRALEDSQVVCGYTTYMDLAREFLEGKELVTTLMTRELERCRIALERAEAGETTAMICSGDAGVYGMAGPILQMAEEFPEVEIEVIPGITAALSGGAVLGAPLMHDFAVISLSDLMVPLEQIMLRVKCAAEGDFVICLYNPKSRKRKDYLEKASDIVSNFRKPETPVGIVRRAGRENSSCELTTLKELKNAEADMFTMVIIGNSTTYVRDGKMITPRGYVLEEV